MRNKQELADTRVQLALVTAERDALVYAAIGSVVTNGGLGEEWNWQTADFMGHGHPTRDEAVAALMAHVMPENPMRPHDSTRQT